MVLKPFFYMVLKPNFFIRKLKARAENHMKKLFFSALPTSRLHLNTARGSLVLELALRGTMVFLCAILQFWSHSKNVIFSYGFRPGPSLFLWKNKVLKPCFLYRVFVCFSKRPYKAFKEPYKALKGLYKALKGAL